LPKLRRKLYGHSLLAYYAAYAGLVLANAYLCWKVDYRMLALYIGM
jgi:hypothetical protein